jgi:RNA polymerase sigma factor (sigma-70 family)
MTVRAVSGVESPVARSRMDERRDDAEDKRLMTALAAGEDLALNQLIARWQRPLRQFVYRFTQHEADTEDLVQETFVRVFRHRTRYQPKSKFSTWLFTIAVNLCRNHAEKQQRRRAVSLDAPPADEGTHDRAAAGLAHELASPEPNPAVATLTTERVQAVRAAIAELPADLREAVLLFEYQDLSHAEIALIAGATPKAIETRLYRARAQLRERLARWLRT